MEPSSWHKSKNCQEVARSVARIHSSPIKRASHQVFDKEKILFWKWLEESSNNDFSVIFSFLSFPLWLDHTKMNPCLLLRYGTGTVVPVPCTPFCLKHSAQCRTQSQLLAPRGEERAPRPCTAVPMPKLGCKYCETGPKLKVFKYNF